MEEKGSKWTLRYILLSSVRSAQKCTMRRVIVVLAGKSNLTVAWCHFSASRIITLEYVHYIPVSIELTLANIPNIMPPCHLYHPCIS